MSPAPPSTLDRFLAAEPSARVSLLSDRESFLALAEAIEAEGYEDTSMLLFTTEEDVEELVDEDIRMKKGRRRAFRSALAAVQSGEGGGRWRGNK